MITISKSVLISIQPYYVFLIIAKAMGWNITQEKTIEVRKTIPKDKNWDRKTIIYCSKNKKSFAKIPKEYQSLMEGFLGRVVGEFVCDKIVKYPYETFNDGEHFMPFGELEKTCLDGFEIYDYLGVKDGYGWYISNLAIYNKPKELGEFYTDSCINFRTGECVSPTNECVYQFHNSQGDIEPCITKLKRPPQSWCYIEGVT